MRRVKSVQIERWITVILVTILVGVVAFAGVRMTYMQAQLINSLQDNYGLLSSQYAKFQEDYGQLYSQYEKLTSDYESLESDFKSFSSDYDVAKGRIFELQSSYRKLESENKTLRSLLDQYEEVPHAYYSFEKFPSYSNHFNELERFLNLEFTLPRSYEINVFDCSEVTAYLEWNLENVGFKTRIAVGPIPWEPDSGYHAWVIVYTEEHTVAIEATALTGEYQFSQLFMRRTPGIVYLNDPLIPGWQNYYEGYDHLFENIYEATRNGVSIEEWNWWEGYWGFK